MRGPARGRAALLLLLVLLLLTAGLVLRFSGGDDGTRPSNADAARAQAAAEVHNASFAPSRETLRAWALFDDVRCTLHVTGDQPQPVLLAATLASGRWMLVSIGEDEVDYDSYRQGSRPQGLVEASGRDAERLFAEGEPCSVQPEGDLSSP